jgi:hypothetical protein
MKTLILLVTTLFSVSSFAVGVTPLVKGDISLSKADARIISVTPVCPHLPGEMHCNVVGSMVKIAVDLGGCVDRMGGYFSSFNVVSGKGVLNFGAIHIFNKASLTAICTQEVKASMVDIYVPFEGEVVLGDLNYDGEIKPLN